MPASERERNASQTASRLEKKGRKLTPVRVAAGGRKITQTFWGGAWCTNLERFSDYENRLPRGRTYVRRGSVIDLQIAPGKIDALVSGSEIYAVHITVKALPSARWRKLCGECTGGVDSLIELLQGHLSEGVMEVLCRPRTGLFPEPSQLDLHCSCPDWANMCKHVAAVLYGVGARLDSEPELLFTLRQVDHTELVSTGEGGIAAATAGTTAEELAGEDLGAIFGIELTTPEPPPKRQPRRKKTPATKQESKRSPSSSRRRAAARNPRITAAELRERGVPNHVVQAWLRKGLATHSGERGIYVRTEDLEALVIEYLTKTRTQKKHR